MAVFFIQAVCAFGFAAWQDDIVPVIGVNPEITGVTVTKLPHDICGGFLCFVFGNKPVLKILVFFFQQRNDIFYLAFNLRIVVVIKKVLYARNGLLI